MWSLSHVQLFCNPMDYIVCHFPLSMGFSRQEYQSGLPCPSSGDLPDPGIKLESPAVASRFFTIEPPGKPCAKILNTIQDLVVCSTKTKNMNGQLTYEQMFNFIPWRWNILFFGLLCVSVFPFQENVNNQFTCYVSQN